MLASLTLPLVLAVPAASDLFEITPIYTGLDGAPSNEVPGLPGATFGSPYGFSVSRNGHWAVSFYCSPPFARVLVVDGQVVLHHGMQAPWGAPGESVSFLARCVVNESGDLLLVAWSGPGGSNSRDRVVRSSAGLTQWTELAVEDGRTGLPYPGTTTWSSFGSPVLDDQGRPGWHAAEVGGLPAGQDDLLVFAGNVLLRSGVSAPPGQVGSEVVESIQDLDLGTGSGPWASIAFLQGPAQQDQVLIVDGAVVLQEGSVVPGSGFSEPIRDDGLLWAHVDRAGNWYTAGENAGSGQEWVVRNGEVVVRHGDPIDGLGAERWAPAQSSQWSFVNFTGNAAGNLLISGATDAPFPDNGALVLDGTHVLARQGQPIDVDRNGLFDDDTYLGFIMQDSAAVTDEGMVYFLAQVRKGTGQATGQGFFSIDARSVGESFCISSPNSTGSPARISGFGSASLSQGDLVLDARPVPPGRSGIFFYGPEAVAVPFGNGFRCVGPGSQLLSRLPASVAGPDGALTWPFDSTAPPTPAGQVTAGSTWYFQAWFRDPGVGSGFDLSDGLELTFSP